jgi:hypothetical protein
LFSLCFTACFNNSNNSNIDTLSNIESTDFNISISSSNESETKDYRELDLSVDNFEHFFNFTFSRNSVARDVYEVTGVLGYAYYDNVLVTFDVVYTKGEDIYKGAYTIKLNAAGYGYFYADDAKLFQTIGCDTYYSSAITKNVTVKAVTGKVVLF